MYMFVFILPSVKWDTNLDKNASFIISKCNIVWAFKHSHAPNSFETIVKGALQAVCIGLPNAHSTFGNDRNYIQFTYTHQKSDELVFSHIENSQVINTSIFNSNHPSSYLHAEETRLLHVYI